jgi:ubiquinone biosynthesis protein Coq4
VVAYLYDTHDVWHVVTGFSTDVAGELGLQAFYLAQFPATLAGMILLAGFANTLFLNFEDRDARMTAITRGWLLGKRASSLFGVRWSDLWSTPLSEVRAQLHLDLPAVDSQLPSAA